MNITQQRSISYLIFCCWEKNHNGILKCISYFICSTLIDKRSISQNTIWSLLKRNIELYIEIVAYFFLRIRIILHPSKNDDLSLIIILFQPLFPKRVIEDKNLNILLLCISGATLQFFKCSNYSVLRIMPLNIAIFKSSSISKICNCLLVGF